jgi:hypothetical protein
VIFFRHRLQCYAQDLDIVPYKIWLSEQCSALRKQNDAASCTRWLREFTDAGGLFPVEENYLISNQFFSLKEGFKLCNELRQVIQIAASELLRSWVSIPVQQLILSDPIFALFCRIKNTFRNVFLVCQTDSGLLQIFFHYESFMRAFTLIVDLS